LAFFPMQGQSISEISSNIAHDLRDQYTIGFTPEKKNDGSFRKIHVELTTPGRGKLQVRTRSGYSLASQKQTTDGAN
jgi:hypothetical protein